MSKVLEKPKSFYKTFERKANSADQINTHYCPGCGHGTLHKLIAEAIDELDIADRTIFLSPVGCSVFAYYYFDTGNIQCAHGRAPAVATGARRSTKNSVVISYQGDGDLAAIGANEIIQAANRGEKIAVFFINNGIYGMTGGQLAPTSQIGQVTMTSPRGRSAENEGYPIRMSEIISTLEAPVYVERVLVGDPKFNNKARKAILKALQIQKDNKGFSFVEVLATCPTNWKMNPIQARKYLTETVTKYYEVKCFKDIAEQRPAIIEHHTEISEADFYKCLDVETGKSQYAPRDLTQFKEQKIRISGFGGQGVLMGGVTLATAGMDAGLNVTWIPSYGPEMRGGTANCHVIISKNKVGSPLASQPNVLIAMNGPSLDSFEDLMDKDSIVLVNSSIVERKVKRTDVQAFYIPFTQIASDLGLTAAANVVALGAYVEISKAITINDLLGTLPKSLKKKNLLDLNLEAVKKGVAYVKEHYPQK